MNKPIAIVNTNCENNIQWYDNNFKQHNGYFLYTHPVELTDEEMLEIYKKVFNKKNEFKENLKRKSYFDFARAILRKAQE